MTDIARALDALEYNRKYWKLQFYNPYEYQRRFHSLKDRNGRLAKARGLMAANQIGKSLSGGAEAAMHLTGAYPDWWEGHRFAKPPLMVAAGVNSYTTRDIIQAELLGTADKDNADLIGTGWIPRHLIVGHDRKPGIPGACEKIRVKHVSGVSEVILLGYEDGKEKFMGKRIDFGWCDEEPPEDIWSQMVRGTIATNGKLMFTFTPENGMTKVVFRFMHELPDNYALLRASWDDAPHITPERRIELMAEMSPHEVEMRSQGSPLVGDSMVFPVPDSDIAVDPFSIPDHWPQILGIDFGGDHPFAVVKMAFDPSGDKKKAYVIDVTKQRRLTISQECSIVKGMGGDALPVAWPHDGNKTDKQSGKPLAQLYREQGLRFLDAHFSNPPEDGKPEGSGGQGIEVGLKRMYWAMTEGRFKVFRHLTDWFKEKGSYHRKDGKIVPLEDDLMSATRYAYQSALDSDDDFRFAQKPNKAKNFFRPVSQDLRWIR